MSSVAVRCYKEHYSPASLETTFTWSTDTKTQILQWDPTFLATVSTLYEELKPSPPWTTFEINHRKTINNDNTAYLFHLLIPPSPGWDTDDDKLPERLIDDAKDLDLILDDNYEGVFSINEIYWALELCHFLHIEANDYILQRIFTTENLLYQLIPFHQMFLRLQYKRGIEACEQNFRVLYYNVQKIVSKNEKMHIEYLNETYSCKIRAYTDFAKYSRHLSTTIRTFLKEILGWEDQMQFFGVWVSMTDKQFIDL
jgi:hypothetical protein